MPGRRAQRICQGGTSGPSSIAIVNVSERAKPADTSDTLRTHTGRHTSAVTCTRDPVYSHKRVCGSAAVSPPDKHSWLVLGCMSVGTHTYDSITQDSSSDCSAPGGGAPLSGPGFAAPTRRW